jgi:quercetin dioxygenase-like cupin family protein/uncharacterized damage-inducible protein DinB
MPEPWTSRSFSFAFPVARIGTLLSRLRGTAPRIAATVRGLPPATLTARQGGGWSIQEHVGHLHDLEAMHLRRLDELARGDAVLSAADMQNQATWQADHNRRPFAEVLAGFVAARAALVTRLQALDADGLARAARHPRLDQPMRAVDVAFFTAEHDDHHLAHIDAELASRPAAPPLPAVAAPWHTLPCDSPLPKLDRRRVVGSEAMLSHVTLHAGCDVPVHAHANEQFSSVLSGRVRFTLADGDRVLGPGEVLHLPPHAPHGACALETAVVLDVFAPPSTTTGIDPRRG